jgi:hypothetical protein
MGKSDDLRLQRRALAACVATGLMAIGGQAFAGDPAGAQVLFDEGKKLMNDGRWAEACPKLEESEKLDPGMGTEFNLAVCYEHVGRTATAWAMYLGVASSARASGQAARERVAREHAAAIEPRLIKMAIVVRAGDEGLRVTRNGIEVGRGQWGTMMPVDPGDQRVTAGAPGKRTWEKTVRATNGATIEIPVLEDEPARSGERPAQRAVMPAMAPVYAEPEPRSGANTQRVIGGALGAAGLVGVGVGIVFGLSSRDKRDEAAAFCNAENQCTEPGLSLRDDAMRAGTISTVAFVAGGAALVGGIVLFATAPRGSSTRATLRATPTAGGMSVSGRF